jgi:serine/threonine-protein kinase
MTWPQTIEQRYRIQGDAPLGSGGMGEVHLYFDLKLSRPVAIKRLSTNVLGRQDAVERFLREARMLASINDVNVVSVYDLVTIDSQLYLITE